MLGLGHNDTGSCMIIVGFKQAGAVKKPNEEQNGDKTDENDDDDHITVKIGVIFNGTGRAIGLAAGIATPNLAIFTADTIAGRAKCRINTGIIVNIHGTFYVGSI